MDTLVSYLIRSTLTSGLLLLFYQGVLRNKKMHSFNRVFLLMTLVAAVALPLIRLPLFHWHADRPLAGWVAVTGPRPVKATGIPVMTLLLLAGGCVSVLLLLTLVCRIAQVFRLRRQHRPVPMEGCYLIEVKDRRAPFSFLNNLFWQEGADIADPVHRKIFDHELAHIRGKHTYDNVFAQSLAALFWMNPFVWLIRRELAMVHEFIADDASIASGDTGTFARMMLQAYDDGRYLDPTHRFFHSPIKRRLLMISTSNRPSGLRKWLALPVLFAVMVLSCSKEQGTATEQAKMPLPPPQPANITLLFKDSLKLYVDRTVAGQIKQAYMTLELKDQKGIGHPITLKMDTIRWKKSSVSKETGPAEIEVEPIPNTGPEAGNH